MGQYVVKDILYDIYILGKKVSPAETAQHFLQKNSPAHLSEMRGLCDSDL